MLNTADIRVMIASKIHTLVAKVIELSFKPEDTPERMVVQGQIDILLWILEELENGT